MRQRWGSHRDQHYESGSLSAFLECITLMHKQSYINFLMIARSKRTYIMYVCPWGHLYLTCCGHLLVHVCMVSQYAWKATQMGRLYFCSHWEIRAKCVVHTFSATICWFPCIIGSWLALSGCILQGCPSTLYHISQPSSNILLHMVESLKVLRIVGHIIITIAVLSRMIQSHHGVCIC